MAANAGGAAGGSKLRGMEAAHTCLAGRNLNQVRSYAEITKAIAKLPSHLFSQLCDVGDVVSAMPGIQRETLFQRHHA